MTGLKSLDDDKKQQMTAIRHRLPPHAALAAMKLTLQLLTLAIAMLWPFTSLPCHN